MHKMQEQADGNKSSIKESTEKQNARDHLANERTLLAWIRTSLGIMAFGFVVVKFSLFIKQISLLLDKNMVIPQHGYSSVIGILLVAVGAIVLLLSFIRFKRTEKQLSDDNYKPSSTLALTLTVFILGISVLLILYMVENVISY